MNRPNINVTPLIDVLLVLLIIFMVVTPLKPAAFKAKIPAETKPEGGINPHTLVVQVLDDGSLTLNNKPVETPENLTKELSVIFEERVQNLAARDYDFKDPNFPTPDNIERTVFIKAPRAAGFGDIARVIDATKSAGAVPISLQVDGLN
jgi:biopolymer transport protein ExbD